MLVAGRFIFKFLSPIQIRKLLKQIKMKSPASAPKNVEQSMKFCVDNKGQLLHLQFEEWRYYMTDLKHLSTMHLMLLLEVMPQGGTPRRQKKAYQRVKNVESQEIMSSGY